MSGSPPPLQAADICFRSPPPLPTRKSLAACSEKYFSFPSHPGLDIAPPPSGLSSFLFHKPLSIRCFFFSFRMVVEFAIPPFSKRACPLLELPASLPPLLSLHERRGGNIIYPAVPSDKAVTLMEEVCFLFELVVFLCKACSLPGIDMAVLFSFFTLCQFSNRSGGDNLLVNFSRRRPSSRSVLLSRRRTGTMSLFFNLLAFSFFSLGRFDKDSYPVLVVDALLQWEPGVVPFLSLFCLENGPPI